MALTVEQTKTMLLTVAQQMVDMKDTLTEIDGKIGDGDHGIGIATGYAKVITKITPVTYKDINTLFKDAGMAMMQSMGGASGVIFGSLYLEAFKGVDPITELDTKDIAPAFERALNAIKKRGGAKVGDKTMVDALEPAVTALLAHADEDLTSAFAAAEQGAAQGVENTKNQIANFGRAKFLGERALGFQDAGATSTYFIFKFIHEWLVKNA